MNQGNSENSPKIVTGAGGSLDLVDFNPAHEFWMEPEKASVEVGDTLKIKIK